MKVKEVIVTIVAGGLLVTGKGGAYVPLLLLLFLIPRENFGEKSNILLSLEWQFLLQ